MNRGWGHVQFSTMLRYIAWDDNVPDAFDLSGHTRGWGFHVSMNYKINKDTLRASVVYGRGIENYMNDAPVDIGPESNPGDIVTPIDGKALPVVGVVAFYDHTWSDRMTSSIGYSRVDIDNSDLQAADAFKTGQYALANLLFTPVEHLMFGPEIQWGQRKNNTDGWSVNDFRVKFSAKFNFGHSWGGQ